MSIWLIFALIVTILTDISKKDLYKLFEMYRYLYIRRMDWQARYREMKKELGFTNGDIAEITGNTESAVRCGTRKNGELPRWVKLSIVVYERMQAELAELKQEQENKEYVKG